MSSIPKSTVKLLRDNITSENSKLITVFRDVREIISEFREWFPIIFEEDSKIESPSDTELLEIVKTTLKQFPNDKILAFFNNVGVRETHEKWSQEVCPKPEDRYPNKGYPQCLTYTYEVKGEQLKKELFYMGCGYNTLAFLGMVTPKQALAEIEKKAMSRYRKNSKEHDAYTLTREIIGHVRNKIKFQRKLTFADLLVNRDKEEKRPSKHVGAWSSLTALIILDKTLEQASKANDNREVSVIVYERFYRDFAGHTVVFNYNNSTLWMYDPQMIKGNREVLSEKGVKAFNYRTFGGLVLIVPDNSRKSKKRRVKNTKRTKKK
jgi:hypothetical protein